MTGFTSFCLIIQPIEAIGKLCTMSIFDFFSKNSVGGKTEEMNDSQIITNPMQKSTNLFSKSELEELIQNLTTISYVFRDSDLLKSTGGGRNEKMMSRTHSYIGILGYFYEVEYGYGQIGDIVDNKISQHYFLVKLAMSDYSHRQKTISELADNWSDILQVIFNMQLESNFDGNKLKQLEIEISRITSAMEKLSGHKCKQPKDLRMQPPREVTYNPLNITESPSLSQGHCIPDITSVLAQELLPQLATCQYLGKSPRDVIANYTISLIKSYYDNAGFVPMVIVDQIIGQVNQVVRMTENVSYSPYPSLKEYVLAKVYR